MRCLAAALAALILATLPAAAYDGAVVETPSLADQVAAGDLPPVAERIPEEPLIVDLSASGRTIGQHGGELRSFITRSRDIRYIVVHGYARLVGYDRDYRIAPDILRDVEVEDGRIFTLHLRRGHRWSDGHPFTAEDFRYWWEDVANNLDLQPGGIPELMLVGGAPPTFEILDEQTVRYTWPAPHPRFLLALAGARPPFIYRPAHYMKQFHTTYRPAEELASLVREERARNWAQLHNKFDNMYRFDNPDLPTLQPWVNLSEKNSNRYLLTRNPYYHRIDTVGQQLPYIDGIDLTIASGGLIPSKVTLGEADLQVRALSFADAPVLLQSKEEGDYNTFLWPMGAGSAIALYPNQNFEDPVWRPLLRDARFRQALSLGVDRSTINQTLYFGLAKERAVAVLEASPFFDPAHAEAFATFDLETANAMLDELGLTERNRDGLRLLPDGRPMEIVVETAGEQPDEGDILEIVAEGWRELGLKLIYRPLDRDILRNRVYSGESMMPVWFGWNNGIPQPAHEPRDLAPVDQTNFAWPMWGQHFQTKEQVGEAPATPEAKRLLELYHAWTEATDEATQTAIWQEMLAIHAEQIFSIGVVSAVPQPVVASRRLQNVPKEVFYTWDPGAQLGVHRIDEFWFAE
ncbi:MAG: ABC transporter substrate-binding protein [Pseudomonadota bacterium]